MQRLLLEQGVGRNYHLQPNHDLDVCLRDIKTSVQSTMRVNAMYYA